MSNIFQNLQLQRIADAIENGQAGGEITIDVTGAGDMQGATASTAGVHGLVPAPQAGDNEKVLSGAGTWVEQSAGGGVDYSLTEQDTGLKWIDGTSPVYQKTLEYNNISQQLNDWVSLGQAPEGLTRLLKYEVTCETNSGWQVSQMYVSFKVQNEILYYYSILGYGTMNMIVTLYYIK